MAGVAALMREAGTPDGLARLSQLAQSPQPLVAPTGLVTLDKVMDTIARFCVQIAQLAAAMQKDIESYGISQTITPERLTSAEGIAHSRRTLAQADQRMERYMDEVMRRMQQYRVAVAEFVPDPKARESVEKEIAPAYMIMVRLGEVLRAMFDVSGRILDFAETRSGRLGLQDGRLVLQDEADRPPLQELMGQLQKVVADVQQIAGEGKQMTERAVDKFSKGE